MRKLFIALGALFALQFSSFTCGASAQTESKIIRAIDSNEDTHYYYYNEQNQLVWQYFGSTRNEYAYNADGQLTSMEQYSWVSGTSSFKLVNSETYSYDADGNMSKRVQVKNAGTTYEVTMTYEYSDYVKGVPTYFDEYKNGSLYYIYKQVSEFDEAGRQTACTVYYADPDDFPQGVPARDAVEFTKEDYKYTKTYDAEGKLVAENTGKMQYEYTYTELDPKYAPKNLMVMPNGPGEVGLSWDEVDGASMYIVTSGNERMEVQNATNFSFLQKTGTHLYTVQAVIDGVERNAATPVKFEVTDPGKLPVATFSVGEIYETVEITDSPDAPTRTFYNIPLSWTLPEGHSQIDCFYIYYNSRAYGNDCRVSVTNPNDTEFLLRVDPFEVAEWDEDGNLTKGIDTPIYMTIVYMSGESAKSPVIVVNPFKVLGHEGENAILVPLDASAKGGVYNLAGQRVSHNQGIVLKHGKKYLAK